ncbi:MAG: chalcone isomerase family protein [Halioglobus sp.]
MDLPDTLNAAGSPLQLNGAGVRKKIWVSIYVGGLYLTAKSSDSEYIIAADQPMALKLHIVSGLVSGEAMEEGFEKATGGNTTPLAEPIEAFMAVFR